MTLFVHSLILVLNSTLAIQEPTTGINIKAINYRTLLLSVHLTIVCSLRLINL